MYPQKAKEALKNGELVVMPTDTIYGLVSSAMHPGAVDRVYQVKHRNPLKPCIILISDILDLIKFDIELNTMQREYLEKKWPGPVSIVLPCDKEKFKYLHHGTASLAFRLPSSQTLRLFLQQTGPLIAPSANPEGKPVAETIEQAQHYFKDDVQYYLDGGTIRGKASRLVSLVGDEPVILRE